MKIRGTSFFFRTTPLIYQPLSFYVKNLKPPPLFGGKKKPKIPPFFMKEWGSQIFGFSEREVLLNVN